MLLGFTKKTHLIGGLLLGGLLLTVSGCTESSSAQTASDFEGSIPEVKVTAISPTNAHGTEGVEIISTPTDEGVLVNVVAASGFSAGSELFLNVSYDPSTAHSSNVESALSSNDGSVVSLALEGEPGSIDFGAVTTAQGETAAMPGDTLLSFELFPGEADPGRFVSSAGHNPSLSRARNLEFLKNDSENWTIEWDYTNPGDNNQDGEVGITDITPIGVNYRERVANSWNDKLRHIDADSNGEINLGDMVPMAMNYGSRIFAYNIEMSENGDDGFIVVGQLVLDDEQEMEPGETVRFSYEFGAQYVPEAWYRVVPLDQELQFGSASEAISEQGRRMTPITFKQGDKALITVFGQNLPSNIAHANAIRVIFPSSFEYVKKSANAGKPGGKADAPDGIWNSFADTLLFPPDSFHIVQDLGNGKSAIDFNVTTLSRRANASPDLYGDIINFRLESTQGEPLTLEFQSFSGEGIDRTYYTDGNDDSVQYGNKLGLRVN
jgi:hypothetical protein